jgi:hypothetical protein
MAPTPRPPDAPGPFGIGTDKTIGIKTMDPTTLLIIVLVVLLIGGGGWYGRGRWY